MLKGALHIHSTYSDGEFTLGEVREIFLFAGCSFACMTDHAESFDADTLKAYVSECHLLSDDRFCFIAGLEYECQQRMHVLGLGVTSLVAAKDPQEVIRHIQREGGVSVIAHPADTMFPWIEMFDTLPHGIEAWNSKYDGRYAPRPGTFDLLRRLQERKPEMHAFYGQDLHWKKQFRGLFHQVRYAAPVRAEILAALAHGHYVGIKENLALPSSGNLPLDLLERFRSVSERSRRMRQLIKGIKKMADGFGIAVPTSVKSHLRRFF
jgi:hypothetical protein